MSFLRAFALATALLFVLQAMLAGAIGLLEFFGLRVAQQRALECMEDIYAPILGAARHLLPDAWLVTGNVLFGFAMILVGMMAYAIAGGLVFGLLVQRLPVRRSGA